MLKLLKQLLKVKTIPQEQVTAALDQAKEQVAPFMTSGLGIAHLAVGFLVMALVTSLGGPTGPALNPARDLGPRLLHAFLPKSVLGEHKGDSKWWYSWVPVVAPIAAANCRSSYLQIPLPIRN